jgi:surface polysaccharide O-acyltransferase-like enzyme
MSYTSSVSTNEMSEIYFDKFKINIVMLSAVAYLLFKNWHYTSPPILKKTIDLVCKYSYAIYLIHLLILTLLFNNGITCSFLHPAISIPAISVLCLALSTLSVYLLKKIPYLRNLIG